MKPAIPREIINTSGRLEKDDRCARWQRLFASHIARDRCNLKIIKSADKSALEALGEEFRKS
jgi:hypothetical protein